MKNIYLFILNDILVCVLVWQASAIFHDILGILNSDLSSEASIVGLFGGGGLLSG